MIRRCGATVAVFGATLCLTVSTGAANAHPAPATHARPATTFGSNGVNALACPSTKQCTALTPTGVQVTFNPGRGGKVITAKIFTNTQSESFALDCATTILCVAADSRGDVIGFDPKREKAKPKYRTSLSGASYQTSVSCPSKSLCVLDSYGVEGYLNPAKKSSLKSSAFSANGNNANPTVTCISSKLCVGSNGNSATIYTFNPRKPGGAKLITLTSTPEVGQISCPSSKQCTALVAHNDAANTGMATFDPRKPGTKPKVHGVSESTMSVIACASKTFCAGAGYDSGVYSYDTKTHKHKFAALPYSQQTLIAALACPSASECVGVTDNGKKTIFNPAKKPKTLKVKALKKKA